MTRISVHSLTSEVGMGSRSRDLVGKELRILRMWSPDTASKEDRALLLFLGLASEAGTDDCSATMIFSILSLKKNPKVLAKSVGLM